MAFSHHSPAVGLSYETRVSSEMDPNFVAIDVRLTFKHRMDGYIYQRILGESNVSFPFRHDSIASCAVAYLRHEFRRWMPALCPHVFDRLSDDIVQYARRAAVTREGGGATIVAASMEVLEEEEQPVGGRGVFTGLQVENNNNDDAVPVPVPDFQDFPHDGDVSSSEAQPRGLSWKEIQRLKQESFKNGEEDESVCSVCLEKKSPGVKISALPCSHSFHHSCIATWLERTASCPLCRLDITNHVATTSFYQL